MALMAGDRARTTLGSRSYTAARTVVSVGAVVLLSAVPNAYGDGPTASTRVNPDRSVSWSWTSPAPAANTTLLAARKTEGPSSTSTSSTALKYKTYMDGRLTAFGSTFDNMARSGNIDRYMAMNYIIDGVTAMYEATRDPAYLARTLQWAEWEIATATVRDSGGYLNWRGPWASPYSSTSIAYQYQELDVARNLMRVARDILVNPSLRTTYGTRAQAVHDFIRRNVVDKWLSPTARNSAPWFLANATSDPVLSNKVAYLGMALLDLLTVDPGLAYASLLDGLITGTTARLAPWGPSGALWINAGSISGDPGNTSHAGLFVHFLTRAHEDGHRVSLAQVQGVAKLMTAVIWNRSTSDPMFTNYTDGSNGSYAGYGPYGYGVIFTGWQTLALSDATASTATAAVLDGIIAGKSNPSLDRMNSVYGQVPLAGYLTRAGW
jgi:hypothetical protein